MPVRDERRKNVRIGDPRSVVIRLLRFFERTNRGHVGLMHHLDLVPLTVKAVHRTPFCSDCCVPDNAFPSLLNCQSMRDVTIAPSGPVATPSSVVVVLSKVAVRDQVHPSPENPKTV